MQIKNPTQNFHTKTTKNVSRMATCSTKKSKFYNHWLRNLTKNQYLHLSILKRYLKIKPKKKHKIFPKTLIKKIQTCDEKLALCFICNDASQKKFLKKHKKPKKNWKIPQGKKAREKKNCQKIEKLHTQKNEIFPQPKKEWNIEILICRTLSSMCCMYEFVENMIETLITSKSYWPFKDAWVFLNSLQRYIVPM